jgi:hypothetical protein
MQSHDCNNPQENLRAFQPSQPFEDTAAAKVGNILSGDTSQQVEELSYLFFSLRRDVEEAAPQAKNVLDELDEFIVELFKKSEAFEAALELYQLEYKGLLIGGARAGQTHRGSNQEYHTPRAGG